ncbi:soluble guanylate cyclase 88E [Ixodes scapularis]
MYGMLLESVQHFVRAEFGESLWQAALSDLGMRNCVFSTHRTYPDDSMTRLAQACATRVTGWSADSFLFFFGRCFVRFFSHYGYDQLIRASGRHLRDFLRGMDNLHHQIRFSYPRMRSPSMQLREEHRLGALLHYQSDRTGLHFYVVGQLVQVAKSFYGMHLVVISIQEVVVELECLGPSESDVEREGRQLLLKGQMRYLKESDVILFLGVPLLSGLQELQDAGLYLEDLCMHDMTRDIVLAGWQHGANLEVSYREQERKTQNLEENLVRLDEWRKRGDDLLYSMLPKSVADSLRQGADPINTCQSFDSVTVLFSELVNFPAACRHLSPMQVVSWVNATFSLFDVITDRYGVFKVETVGHVYMLVSGAPERRPDHADQVCAAALEMLSALQGTGQPFHEHGTHLRAGEEATQPESF